MIGWTTAFLDGPAPGWSATLRFWQAVTASTLSPFRGPDQELVTLLPSAGDPYLRAQRTGAGPAGVHLDLHVPDVRGVAAAAVALGAREVAASEHVVLVSPGGMLFCVVRPGGGDRPPPTRSRTDDGRSHAGLVDQLTINVPSEHWAQERRFWSTLTGWPQAEVPADAGLVPLLRPDGIPLRLMLQRLDETAGSVRAHLDLATTDRAAETARHVALGARVEAVRARWTVLVDPAGRRYCLTDRDPATGRLPG